MKTGLIILKCKRLPASEARESSIRVTLSDEANITDLGEAFRTFALALGYTVETVNKILQDE